MSSLTPDSVALQNVDDRVAIVTVSYGSEAVLPGFLASVRASSMPSVLVVIADNKASASVKAIANEHGASYLKMPSNQGYGGAINAAARELPDSIEWILVSNPDITIAPQALEAMLAVGLADSTVGAIGPQVLTAEGEVYPSARAIPSIRTGIGHALFANVWPSNPWTLAYRNSAVDPESPRTAGWLSGACVLVRRSVFTKLDGFDTTFFMYFEDVDLGYRITKAGYRNVYAPSASVVHTGAHSTTSAESATAMIKAHHDSAKLFIARKYPGAVLAPLRWVLGLGLDIRARAATRQGH